MPVFNPTNINAYYSDLSDAKQALAEAQGKVDQLEEQIVGQGYELPTAELPLPQLASEDTASSENVSAVEEHSKAKTKDNPLPKGSTSEVDQKPIQKDSSQSPSDEVAVDSTVSKETK